MSKAIRIEKPGPPDVMHLEEINISDPQDDEVQLRQSVIGVNYLDIYLRSGLYPLPAPHIPGLEGVGIIEKTGKSVSEFKSGDRVAYGVPPFGAYAEIRNIPWHRLVMLPDEIDDETAGAMMMKGIAAEFLTHRVYEVKPGDTVLFHAAAGGVGLLACQWLQQIGARVIGTVGSNDKIAIARAHGCTDVINYNEEDFVEHVMEITQGKGVRVLYDGVGKATFLKSLECVGKLGLAVLFGNSSGIPEPLNLFDLKKASIHITRPTITTFTETRDDILLSTNRLFNAVKAGQLKIKIHKVYPFADAAQAHHDLENRLTTGSCILRV